MEKIKQSYEFSPSSITSHSEVQSEGTCVSLSFHSYQSHHQLHNEAEAESESEAEAVVAG